MPSQKGLRLHLFAAHDLESWLVDKMVAHLMERGAANEYAALGRIHRAYHATELARHERSFGVDGSSR